MALSCKIESDAREIAFYGADIYSQGKSPQLAFLPTNLFELQEAVEYAKQRNLNVIPRGGSMSYSGGIVGNIDDFISIDISGLNKVLEFNESDFWLEVECGITWREINDFLRPRGLRPRSYGTLSGIRATVGGGLSNDGVFWGANNGTICDNILSLRVVTAENEIIEIGSNILGRFGPGLKDVFLSDCGAFGIKYSAVLPLERIPQHSDFVSFEFLMPRDYVRALSEVGKTGAASEVFGFDPFLTQQRMKRDSLVSDAKSLLNTVAAEKSILESVRTGVKIALAGRDFIEKTAYSFHVICEGRSKQSVIDDIELIRTTALKNGGKEIENSIPKVLYSNPFPPVNSILGPNGERWAPIHGLVAHSKAASTLEALKLFFETKKVEMEKLEIGIGLLFVALSNRGILIEPVFYWPDEAGIIQRKFVEKALQARHKKFAANPIANAAIEDLRNGILAIFKSFGASHFQIGRLYDLMSRVDEKSWQILIDFKKIVDKNNRMNPGVLGL